MHVLLVADLATLRPKLKFRALTSDYLSVITSDADYKAERFILNFNVSVWVPDKPTFNQPVKKFFKARACQKVFVEKVH